MKIEEILTPRKKALDWWRKLSVVQQMRLAQNYFTRDDSVNLTGREIEKIWKEETNQKPLQQDFTVPLVGNPPVGTTKIEDLVYNALNWANKRLELLNEPITAKQQEFFLFALLQQIATYEAENLFCSKCGAKKELDIPTDANSKLKCTNCLIKKT